MPGAPPASGPSISPRHTFTTMVTGRCSAKSWSHPGMELTGTNAELANVSGSRKGKAIAGPPAADVDRSPTIASGHDGERRTPEQHPALDHADQAVRAEADESAPRNIAPMARGCAPGRRACARPARHGDHREPAEQVDDASAEVFGEPDGGRHGAEGDGLHEDAQQQVDDVVHAEHLDRASTERVAEQEREQRGLDEREHEPPGLARQVEQVPLVSAGCRGRRSGA